MESRPRRQPRPAKAAQPWPADELVADQVSRNRLRQLVGAPSSVVATQIPPQPSGPSALNLASAKSAPAAVQLFAAPRPARDGKCAASGPRRDNVQ